MTTKQDTLNVCETIEQVVKAGERVKYVPHALQGSFEQFLRYCGDTTGWDEVAFMRAFVAYATGGLATPYVVSLLHNCTEDDCPSIRLICYGVSYGQLITLDERLQPSWFNITVEPDRDDEQFIVTLVPTRSLSKLLTKQMVI